MAIDRRASLAALVCAATALCACERTTTSSTAARGDGTAVAPSFDPARQKLALQLEAAFKLIEAGRHAEGRAHVERYLEGGAPGKRPGQAEFLIGLSYHRPELFEEAEPHFARAVELEPDYLATYYYRGFCRFQLGRIEEAREDFETYLGGAPDKPEGLFGLALVALEEDRPDEAEALLERAIAVTEARAGAGRPSDATRADLSRYHARLSDVYLRRDELARAQQALERSVELWPAHYESWHKLHRVLVRLGEDAAAERAWRQYEEIHARRFPERQAAPR